MSDCDIISSLIDYLNILKDLKKKGKLNNIKRCSIYGDMNEFEFHLNSLCIHITDNLLKCILFDGTYNKEVEIGDFQKYRIVDICEDIYQGL